MPSLGQRQVPLFGRLFGWRARAADAASGEWTSRGEASVLAAGTVGRHDASYATRALRVSPAVSTTLIAGLLAVADAAAVLLTGALALVVYADVPYIAAAWPLYAGLCLTGAAVMLQVGRMMGLYRRDVTTSPFLRPWQAAASWATAMLALLALVFFFRRGDEVSRAWVGLWFALALGTLAATRVSMRGLVIRWRTMGLLSTRVIVVAETGDAAASLSRRLSQPLYRDTYRVMGVLPLDAMDGVPPGQQAIAPDDLLAFLRDEWIETVVICCGPQPSAAIREVARALDEVAVNVLVLLDETAFAMPVIRTQHLAGLSMLQVGQPPLGDGALLAKSIVDRSLSAIVLSLLVPILALVALAIKLETRGPVLFRQQRFGLNNRPFSVLKFRTMHVALGDVSGARRTVRYDARVTAVGRVLRATSLDELPQLVNVLRGEMSLVGPRAHPVMMRVTDQLYHEAVDRYAARHRVKPGITGLAQINGHRGEVDTLEKARARVHYDLEYVSRWSLWLDFKIMMLTPFKAFRSY